MYDLKFDKKEVAKAEKDYGNVQTTPEQRQWIEHTAGIYTKYIPISDMAIKGFILYSMQKFQVNHQFDLRDYLNLSKEEREQINNEMVELIRGRLNMILVNKDQIPLLKQASDKVLDYVNSI